jgi:hypothetical protein
MKEITNHNIPNNEKGYIKKNSIAIFYPSGLL